MAVLEFVETAMFYPTWREEMEQSCVSFQNSNTCDINVPGQFSQLCRAQTRAHFFLCSVLSDNVYISLYYNFVSMRAVVEHKILRHFPGNDEKKCLHVHYVNTT